MELVTSSVAWAARRLNPLARVVGVLAAATAIGAAQERWDEPVTVSGSVTEGEEAVEGATVTATPFLRPLLTAEQRLRAFRPARTSTTTRADGGFSLRLPEWTLGCDAPVAVIASRADGSFSGELHGEYVEPRRRETHRGLTPSIRKEASVRIRLVDQESGRPLGGVRVAALVCIPPTLKIPRGAGGYCHWDNLVVGAIGRTDADGWIARDAGTVILLVEREGDAVPAAPRADVADGGTVRVPAKCTSEEATAALQEGFLREDDAPPSDAEVAEALRRKFAGTCACEGFVVDPGGAPIAGAEVSVVAEKTPLDPLASFAVALRRPAVPFAQTDDEGRFRILRLPPGRCRMQIAAKAYPSRLTGVLRLSAGETRPMGRLRLWPGASLMVENSMGYVWFGAGVYVKLPEESGVVRGLPAGRYAVSNWNGGCCFRAPVRFAVPAAGTVVLRFDD